MNSGTIGGLLKEGAAILCAADVEAPEHDAKVLLAHVLDLKLGELLLRATGRPDSEQEALYRHLLALRTRRMPLQYVTRNTFFGGLELKTDDRALIPRSETEQLVEAVVTRLTRLLPGAHDYVVDVGCGSGAIGLCLANQVPHVQVVMTDLSRDALDLAAENATRLELAERVILLQGSYLDPVRHGGLAEGVVAVISNPPYVRPDEMPGLEPEVRAEPRLALESLSEDGLEAYRVLAAEAPKLPRLKLLAFEVGFAQAQAVAGMFESHGDVEILLDYSGIERMVIVHVRR